MNALLEPPITETSQPSMLTIDQDPSQTASSETANPPESNPHREDEEPEYDRDDPRCELWQYSYYGA